MKKVLSMILILVLLVSCATCSVSITAAAQNSSAAKDKNKTDPQPPINGNDGPYEDGWVYQGSNSGGRGSDLAPIGASSISDKEIEVNLKAVRNSDRNTVSIGGATVCLYVGTELRRTVKDNDNDGIVKVQIDDLKPEEYEKATISAYKKVAEGKAQDGNNRNAVYAPFKDTKGNIIRYEYELHSETIDNNGNWNGETLTDGKKADVVFVIDSTGSMGNEIASVKNNIASFAETLINAGVNARFSIIDYRDITNGEPTTIHKFAGSQWAYSLKDVTNTLSNIKADGGGDANETPIDALGAVASNELLWRLDAKKYAFLYTDAGYKTNNNYGFTRLSQLADRLKSKKICTSVITTSSYKSTYRDLYESTNGIYADLSGSFSTSMQQLAENILLVSRRRFTLTLQEPRIKYNLTACYLSDDEDSRSDTYRANMQKMLREYANDISQTTDGHVFINKIYLFNTNDRMNFFNTTSHASMADIQIQADKKDSGTWLQNVKIHSNAHVFGFYHAGSIDSKANVDHFKNIWNIDSYKDKNCFERIQMSAIPYVGGKSFDEYPSHYAETVTHESGHYIFGFLDEYGYLSEDGDIVSWDNWDGATRPNGRKFGLMDHQHEDIEMSKRTVQYQGLECLTNMTRTNSPGQFFGHNGMTCEDLLADILTEGFSDLSTFPLGDYRAHYTKVSTVYNRTADYPWLPVTFVNYSGGLAATGAEAAPAPTGVNFDAMTKSDVNISDTSYSVSGSTVTFALTPQSGKSYSAYYKRSGDDDFTKISAVTKSGKTTFSYTMSANSAAEIRLVETGTTSRYVKYYLDASPSTNTGYIFTAVDGTTQAYENVTDTSTLYHISDRTKKTNGSWFSVNNSTYISADSPANINGGEIYSVASCAADIDYTSVSWFVYRNGTWTKLPTNTSAEENNNIGARADTVGEGLYVLMAKKASTSLLLPAADLKYTADNTLDGRITVSFKDNNTGSKYYRVFVSEKAFTSADEDGVTGRIFDAANGTDLTVTLEKTGVPYYLAVEIVSESGATSKLAFLSVTGQVADRDNDGIPDSYCDEYALWGAEGEEKDIANSDDDGDGLTNLEEYLRGSDPKNPNDPVKTLPTPVETISVSASTKTIRIGESFKLSATITPSDATDKSVTWSTEKDGFVQLTSSGASCTVKGLKAGTVNVYAVSADGGYSAACAVTVTSGGAVTAVKLNKTAVSLTYGKTYTLTTTVSPSNASNKSITWSTSNSSIATVSAKGVVTAKGAGTATITAKSASGKTATCTVTVSLPTPKLVSVANTASGVQFKWNKSAGAVKYRVFRKTGFSAWKKVADTTSLSYVDKTVRSGTKYAYTVRCISANGKTFTSSFDSAGKLITYIAAPNINSIANTVSGVQFKWKKPTGAVKFRIFRKIGSGAWKKLADTTSLSYLDKSVKSGVKYSYTIRCITKNGKSFTSAYNTTGKSITFIAVPKISSITNTASGVQFNWKKPAGAVKFRIFRKTGSGAWKKLADTTGLTYLDKTVKVGNKYSYTIRCISKNGRTFTSGLDAKGTSIYYQNPPVSGPPTNPTPPPVRRIA